MNYTTFYKSLAALAVAAVITGCATQSLSMPSAEKLVEMGAVETTADLAALNRGRAMAIMDCLDCHRQYWPQEYHEKRWPTLSREMGKLAGMSDDQIRDLTRYMETVAGIEPEESREG